MIAPLATLLLAAVASFPPTTLVLRSGHRLEVEGPIRQQDGQIIFREPGGALYSIPIAEVDMEATRAVVPPAIVVVRAEESRRRLRVSAEERQRLLEELEKNHSGQPATDEQRMLPPATPSRVQPASSNGDEWSWRNRARSYQEGVARAREELALLRSRVEMLRQQITGFLSLGYKPSQFTYQTTELVRVQEQLPWAELEVTRAERARDQFYDDARRQGILPGWLR